MKPLLYPRSLSGFSLALVVCTIVACSKPDVPQVASTGVPGSPSASPVVPATSGAGMSAKLCGVLRSKVPELKGMPAVGARAQLVIAIGTAFNADANALGTVSSDIDTIASANCPEVREPLLTATKAASLQEAVR